MGTSHRVIRKAIAQPAKPRRSSTPYVGCFASCQECTTSLAGGADSYLVRRFKSNKFSQSHVESERFSRLHSVPLSARRCPQTVLQPGNLYGFPTAGGGSSQGRLVIEPTRVMLGRSRITRALPLAREAIPQESDFILDVNTSVWPGCNFPHFVVNRVSS